MTKGQSAMAVALMFPEGRQGKANEMLNNLTMTRAYLSNARAVVKYAPEYTSPVLAVAMIYPEGQWKKLVKNTTLSTEYVTKARPVIQYAPKSAG